VFNLGVNTPLEEFFDAVVETGAEVLMISSLNGEAEGWGREVKLLRSKYRNLDDVIMMIGGNLVVGSGDAEEIVARYRNYGFDLVCHQVDLNTGLELLQALMERRGRA
jgi:methylaspartate mutase sigma subunit